jgi:hypothetical protein
MVMDTHPDDGGQVLLADGVEDCYEAITRLRANLAQLWRTKTTNAKLRAELAQRTAERDDARTLFCMNHPLVVSGDNEARDVARRHGWDCFKEEGQ